MAQNENGCGCKIGRVSTEYGLDDIDFRLTEDWRSGTSLRQLADELNKDVIESALATVDVGRAEWSRTPVYEALYTDELSEAQAIEIRRELERAGIDVEQLASDLVSHQTVYRHLTQCLETSKTEEKNAGRAAGNSERHRVCTSATDSTCN